MASWRSFPAKGRSTGTCWEYLACILPEVRQVLDLMDRAYENHRANYLLSDAIFPPPLRPPLKSQKRLYNMTPARRLCPAPTRAIMR